MIERVLLVAWKGSAATSWVETLKSGGYTVLLEDTTGERAWRTAKERGIDVVIIDGQKKPSHGRQTGHALRDTAKTRNIPIIWTNLDAEDSAAVQTDVKPDMTLIAPTDAVSALAALQLLHSQVAANAPVQETVEVAPPPPPPAPVAVEVVETVVSADVEAAAPVESPVVAPPPEPPAVEPKKTRRPVVKKSVKAPAKKKALRKATAAKRATPKKSKSPAKKKTAKKR